MYGDAVQVAALVTVVAAAVWLMYQEYQQTGTVLYGPNHDTEVDSDSPERDE